MSQYSYVQPTNYPIKLKFREYRFYPKHGELAVYSIFRTIKVISYFCMHHKLNERFKKIKLLITDFDGVMTDGYVYVDERGKETVRCSRKDGLGVEMLKNAGIGVAIISKEKNSVVAARAKKLHIDFWQEVYDGSGKLQILKNIAERKKLSLHEIAYMGDDLNDLKVLESVGLAITVSDGHEQVKSVCHYITNARGGEHAVREICEKILEAKNIDFSF